MADGVSVVACTPHILPGLYHNSGPQIRQATRNCSRSWTGKDPLRLVTGADNHIVPSFVADLRSGHLLSLADTRYVSSRATASYCTPAFGGLVFLYIGGGLRSDLHPSRAANLDHVPLPSLRAIGSSRSLDPAHGRLPCWPFWSKCTILG